MFGTDFLKEFEGGFRQRVAVCSIHLAVLQLHLLP